MFAPDAPDAHAWYVMDLLHQRQERQFWNSLFEQARKCMLEKKWNDARTFLEHGLELTRTMQGNSEVYAIRQRAGYDLLMGACYWGTGDLDQAMRHFAYAVQSFPDGADDYGNAVFLYALGLAYEIRRDWDNAFVTYTRTIGLIDKPMPIDDTLRHMRVDVKMHLEQVQCALFTKIEANAASTSKTAEPNPPSVQTKNSRTNGSSAKGTEGKRKPTDAFYPSDGLLQLFPHYQTIGAGPGIWDQPYKELDIFLQVKELQINDQAYTIYPRTSTNSRALQIHPKVAYGLFEVEGDSMLDCLAPGDFVLAQRTDNNADVKDDIACVSVEQGGQPRLVVKWFRLTETGVRLESENKNYDDLSYAESEVKVLGKVVAVLKKTL